jgi:hypothetical protein
VDPFSEEHEALVLDKLVAVEGICDDAMCSADGRFFRHKGKLAPALPSGSGGTIEIEGAGKLDVDCRMAAEGEESHVYQCVRVGAGDSQSVLAIKVCNGNAYNEWYSSRIIHSRVAQEDRRLFVEYEQAHFYDNACVFLSPWLGGGTLQRAIRVY